jgi:adenylylsulfate kinase
MKILIFGLPGSGKTTFAKELIKDKDCCYFNADEIRKMYNDWDFSKMARVHQAVRMEKLNKSTIKNCVTDFVCPYPCFRNFYDITIWMNTIKKDRYEDTNQLFELSNNATNHNYNLSCFFYCFLKKFLVTFVPRLASTYVITDYNYENVLKEIRDKL